MNQIRREWRTIINELIFYSHGVSHFRRILCKMSARRTSCLAKSCSILSGKTLCFSFTAWYPVDTLPHSFRHLNLFHYVSAFKNSKITFAYLGKFWCSYIRTITKHIQCLTSIHTWQQSSSMPCQSHSIKSVFFGSHFHFHIILVVKKGSTRSIRASSSASLSFVVSHHNS